VLLRLPEVCAVPRAGLARLPWDERGALDHAPAGIGQIDPEEGVLDAVVRDRAPRCVLHGDCRPVLDEAAADIPQGQAADGDAVGAHPQDLALTLTVQHCSRLTLERELPID